VTTPLTPKVAAVILARLDSSRLPGKALLPVAGIPLILRVYRRLMSQLEHLPIVLATTDRPCDSPLAEVFEAHGGRVYRGGAEEVQNVAKRFIEAAKSVGADYALRINGDSPFPSYELLTSALPFIKAGQSDLITNLLPRTYPYGISLEVVRVSSLDKHLPLLSDSEKEHVTAVFYAHPDSFQITAVPPSPWEPCPHRLTVDEPGDLALMERIFALLGPHPETATLPEVIAAARKIHQ